MRGNDNGRRGCGGLGWGRRGLARGMGLVLGVALAGCTIDASDACGAHQTLVSERANGQHVEYCVCDEKDGYVFNAKRGHGCTRCDEDEFIRNGACAPIKRDEPDAGMDGEPGRPTGIGAPCQSNADCAGFDAQLCDVIMTHSCVLDRCANGDNVCPPDMGCCDLSHLAPNISVCVEGDVLEEDGCPMGGTLVEP